MLCSLVERPHSKHHPILLRGTVSLKIPQWRYSKSLFVATKIGYGGRLLRSLNATKLPVERSNHSERADVKRRPGLFVLFIVVTLVRSAKTTRRRRRRRREHVSIDGVERSPECTIIFLPTNDTRPHSLSALPYSQTSRLCVSRRTIKSIMVNALQENKKWAYSAHDRFSHPLKLKIGNVNKFLVKFLLWARKNAFKKILDSHFRMNSKNTR